MQKLACLSISLLAGSALAQGTITPLALNNNPNLGASVINRDANNVTITALEQIELQSLGAGIYRTTVTALMSGQTGSTLVTGNLDMTQNPPVWTPNNDVNALNTGGSAVDEFAGSFSADGLVFVWDNYLGATYLPNVPAPATTFVCKRASTAVPFSTTSVFAVAGVAAGGVDPHIGGQLANGNVILYHIDANGDISKGELNPNNGVLSNLTLAVANSARPNWRFSHSPATQRDSTGVARALTYSEYMGVTGAPSDGFWTEGVNNDGTPVILANATTDPQTPWFANPAVVGGTWNWATATASYGDPSMYEGIAVANATLTTAGGRVVAFAPMRPRLNGTFFVIVAIGIPTTPYPLPPVIGNIEILPVIGVLDARLADPFTGLAEWVFGPLPTGLGGPYTMQVIGLDNATGNVVAGNTATLIAP